MRLEFAFKTDKSLRRSDGLRETVPDSQIGNIKGSVSELCSCPWNNEVYRLLAERRRCLVLGRYWQMQRILSGTRGSDCREP